MAAHLLKGELLLVVSVQCILARVEVKNLAIATSHALRKVGHKKLDLYFCPFKAAQQENWNIFTACHIVLGVFEI